MAQRTVSWRLKSVALAAALGTMTSFSVPSTYNLNLPEISSQVALPESGRFFVSTPSDVAYMTRKNFQRRVAVNALLQLGVLEMSDSRIGAENPYGLRVSSQWKLWDCVNDSKLKLQRGATADLTGLVISIVATENFSRTGMQRFLKLLLSRVWARSLGTLPPFSLGIAEVKPRSIVQVLGGEVETGLTSKSEPIDIVNYLGDDCNSITAVAAIVDAAYSELQATKPVDDWNPIIRRFHGDIEDSPAPFGYSQIVQNVLYVYVMGSN